MRAYGVLGALLSPMMPKDSIPLKGFGSARSGPLSEDLRRYAPKLFDGEGPLEGPIHIPQQ